MFHKYILNTETYFLSALISLFLSLLPPHPFYSPSPPSVCLLLLHLTHNVYTLMLKISNILLSLTTHYKNILWYFIAMTRIQEIYTTHEFKTTYSNICILFKMFRYIKRSLNRISSMETLLLAKPTFHVLSLTSAKTVILKTKLKVYLIKLLPM